MEMDLNRVIELIVPNLKKFESWTMEDDVDFIENVIELMHNSFVVCSENCEIPDVILLDSDMKRQYMSGIETFIMSKFLEVFIQKHADKINFKGVVVLYQALSIMAQERGWQRSMFTKVLLLSTGFAELLLNGISEMGKIQAEGSYYN